MATEIETEPAHDDRVVRGDALEATQHLGQHRTGERQIEEEHGAVVEVRVARVRLFERDIDAEPRGDPTRASDERGLEFDAACGRAREESREDDDLPDPAPRSTKTSSGTTGTSSSMRMIGATPLAW